MNGQRATSMRALTIEPSHELHGVPNAKEVHLLRCAGQRVGEIRGYRSVDGNRCAGFQNSFSARSASASGGARDPASCPLFAYSFIA